MCIASDLKARRSSIDSFAEVFEQARQRRAISYLLAGKASFATGGACFLGRALRLRVRVRSRPHSLLFRAAQQEALVGDEPRGLL